MKLKLFSPYILSLSIFACLLLGAKTSFAAEGGGQVGQDAGIEFYVDETESSLANSEQPGSPAESAIKKNKPVGKLPKTGEVVKKSLAVSGISLLIGGTVFFLIKKFRAKKG